MIPAMITLVVGLAIVIVSFFLTDGRKDNTEEELLEGGRSRIEKELDEFCSALVDKKKNDLKKQGEEVKSNMQKGLDEVKKSSKKELDDIKKSSAKEIEDIKLEAKKSIEEFRDKSKSDIDSMKDDTEQRIEKALKAYRDNISEAKKNMEAELQACQSQLSEKAKKQMIDYINKSLAEAYEECDTEDGVQPEPITYDEPEEQPAENQPEQKEASAVENQPDNESEPAESHVEQEEVSPAEDQPETTAEPAESQMEQKADDEKADSPAQDASEKSGDSTVAYSDEPVVDSAFAVVEEEQPKPQTQDRRRNNRSKKKKRKSEQRRPVEIWDEGEDVEAKVAELHKKGLSIMEIANRLGIGVGEAKVMIDNIENADKQ